MKIFSTDSNAPTTRGNEFALAFMRHTVERAEITLYITTEQNVIILVYYAWCYIVYYGAIGTPGEGYARRTPLGDPRVCHVYYGASYTALLG